MTDTAPEPADNLGDHDGMGPEEADLPHKGDTGDAEQAAGELPAEEAT